MFETRFLRAAPAFVLAFAAFTFSDAEAASPPDMALPPCVEVDGQRQGACPQTNADVTGSAMGTLGAGGSVTIVTEPTNGVCVYHYGHGPDYPWTPSPCYSGVSAPSVAGCAVIDLTDGGRFREISCSQALYKVSSSAPSPLFSYSGPGGRNGCGRRGDFYTYLYGGPANVAGARWSEFGPAELECQLRFNGPRPDGMYGPTWVKVRVGIEQAQTGNIRTGYGRSAEIYVPIDGDMRDVIDVELQASSVLSGSGDNITITYTATLTNRGNLTAENVELFIPLSKHVHFKSVSNARCVHSGVFVGGNVQCEGLTLAGAGASNAGDFEVIDIVTRLINASDFEKPEVRMTATVPNDLDPSDNVDSTSASPTLSSGSIAQTREAMRALEPYFDYRTPDALLDTQCNKYMDDIYERLQAIHAQAPEVFDNLSYAKITSGTYYWAPIESDFTFASHVGVVVYQKGTNYHETGIVVHGTPTFSPADRDREAQLGTQALGEHLSVNPWRQGTADHGLYYRTPIQNFPGSPRVEAAEGCGLEGVYPDNRDEFLNVPSSCGANVPAQQTCPAFPDAVTVMTESPVDILVTNSKGQRVETQGGMVFLQELDTGIHSFATPHEDGTFGWLLVLPEDDYDIQLLGTGEGPYKLTLTKFDADGNPVQTVHEGTTVSGQVNDYELDGAPLTPPGGGGDTGGNNGGNNGGVGNGDNNGGGAATPAPRKNGGGSFGFLTLLALLPLVRWRVRGA